MAMLYERDYNIRLLNLPTSVPGFVREKDDYYTIVLNARHTFERNRGTYRHEEYHLINDDYSKDDVDIIEMRTHQR